MKELYIQYFRIPSNVKITDKIMLVRITLTVCLMVMCLAAMGLSAYAYFSHTVTSGVNTLVAADFDISVKVNEVDLVDGVTTLERGQHEIYVERTGSASTGFAVIEITVGDTTVKCHTRQLDAQLDSIQFVLDLSQIPGTEPISVKVKPHWGTSTYYGYGAASYSYIVYDEQNVDVAQVIRQGANPPMMSPAPTVPETEPEVPPTTPVVYTIVSGDTLSRIANRYGVTVDQIVARNEIANPNLIYVGQRIVIPLDERAASEEG